VPQRRGRSSARSVAPRNLSGRRDDVLGAGFGSGQPARVAAGVEHDRGRQQRKLEPTLHAAVAKVSRCAASAGTARTRRTIDLAGNVSEYASGGYVQYAGSPDRGGFKDSTWLAVSKGGNYYQDDAGALTSSHRAYNTSGVGQGFRCAF